MDQPLSHLVAGSIFSAATPRLGIQVREAPGWSILHRERRPTTVLLGQLDFNPSTGDPQNLQCLAGSAPVTKRSGKQRSRKHWHVHQRWACDKHLRHAIHLFAEQSLSRCLWAQIYYQHHRQKNQCHANALRRLAHRWLKIIYKMWIDRTTYDAELHHCNQLQHGSWIFQLQKS